MSIARQGIEDARRAFSRQMMMPADARQIVATEELSRDDGSERPDALDGRAVRFRRHFGRQHRSDHQFRRATAAELPDYTFDEAAVRPWIGRPFAAMLAEQGVSDHDQWMTVYRRHYRKAHNEMLRPIEGISGLLERLADTGARIGMVSSKYIDLGLNRLGLGSWIDVIVSANDTQRHKPHPEPLLHAAGLLDAKPSRGVYVGDAVTDVVAGRAAGMATIAVSWGAATAHDLAEAARPSSAASPN